MREEVTVREKGHEDGGPVGPRGGCPESRNSGNREVFHTGECRLAQSGFINMVFLCQKVGSPVLKE